MEGTQGVRYVTHALDAVELKTRPAPDDSGGLITRYNSDNAVRTRLFNGLFHALVGVFSATV